MVDNGYVNGMYINYKQNSLETVKNGCSQIK